MEFLDPEEKRTRTIRLFLGYGLLAFMVIAGTFILSFALQGFDLFSRRTDVRNGLLFVDSKPVSANIYINGEYNKRTEARHVLPEGKYDLKLTAEGYRDWQKNIVVTGGNVVYQTYPRLFPLDIKRQNTVLYAESPILRTQSRDRKWILQSQIPISATFDVFNTNNPDEVASPITVPSTVIAPAEYTGLKLEAIEWSTDNRHVLVQKTLASGESQYIIIDREKPEESFNVTTKLLIPTASTLRLRDKKFDQYYVLGTDTKQLRRASVATGIEPVILADGVVAYSPYERDIIMYATTVGAAESQYSIRVINGSTQYVLQPVTSSDTIMLDIARYEGDWYYAVGSSSQEFTAVYINPLSRETSPQDLGVIRPQIRLLNTNARFVSFSDNTRFIGVQSATDFTVYDAEMKQIYRFKSPVELPVTGATWMDGHRYSVVSGNNTHVFEFDGKNLQTLVPALDGTRSYFDRDYVRLFNIAKQADGTFGYQVSTLTVE